MDEPIQLLYVVPAGDDRRIEEPFREDAVAVTVARDGHRAIEILGESSVDCVIGAFDLPDGDGLDLYDRVRDRAPGTPFVLFPVDGDESLASEAIAAGVDGYVPADADADTVRDRVVDLVTADANGSTTRAGAGEDHSLLVEQSPIAIIEWDLDFRVVDWNPAAEDLFGYDRSTALGRDGPELIVPEPLRDRIREGWDGLLADADGTRYVNENVRADGTRITCEWHNAPVVEAGEVVSVVSFVRDVTEERRRSDTLEALQEATPRLLRASTPVEVAESAVEVAESVLGHPLVTVRLHEDRSGKFRLAATSEAADELLVTTDSTADDAGLLGDVYDSGVRQVYHELTPSKTVHGESFAIESAILEPLGEHGLLAIGATRSDAFETLDVHFADILAATTEAALDRATIAAELRDRNEKIENLHAVVGRLEACETETEIWELTVDVAEGVLNFDECGVDEVVDDRMVARATSSDLLPEGYVESAPAEEGIAGKTYVDGETHVIDDLRDVEAALPENEAYRSLLSVPIGDVGVFQAISTNVGAFDENDTDLAELLMAHVADELERVRFEAELREERDQFAALFENVPDPVVFAEHREGEPIVRSVNPAFESAFGFDEPALVGENINEYIVPPDRRDEQVAIDEEADAGNTVEREVRRRTADGLRDFRLTVVPVDPESRRQRTFGVYTDITERKQREQRVAVLNRVLRHDLRNGMNIIKGAAETLGEAVDGPDEQYAGVIVERADELIGMAEKTRTVERTLDRDVPVGAMDLVQGVEHAVDSLRTKFPEATFEIDAPETARIEADDLLETAIYHVLENACLHNDRTPDVVVRIEERQGQLRVSVADNGPGIPEAERALLTENREITQLRHASGLGLWLVNWVVTQAGGSIAFEDNQPRGSIVTLRLPKLVDRSVPPERPE
jgi:PAS domain S-box-containing protein